MTTKLDIPTIIFIYFLTQSTIVLFTLNSHFKVHILTFLFPLCLFDLSLALHRSLIDTQIILPHSPQCLTSFCCSLCVFKLPSSAISPSFSLWSRCVRTFKIWIRTCLLQTMISLIPQRSLPWLSLVFQILPAEDLFSASPRYPAWLPSLHPRQLLKGKFTATPLCPAAVAIIVPETNLTLMEILWAASARRSHLLPHPPPQEKLIKLAKPFGLWDCWILHCPLYPEQDYDVTLLSTGVFWWCS